MGARIQWGSENQPFKNRNHSKTGHFGGRFLNGRISNGWDHSYSYSPDHLKSGQFKMAASLDHCECKHNFYSYIKQSSLKMSGFQMVGTSTPFENRTKMTIRNPDMSGFRIPTVYIYP